MSSRRKEAYTEQKTDGDLDVKGRERKGFGAWWHSLRWDQKMLWRREFDREASNVRFLVCTLRSHGY